MPQPRRSSQGKRTGASGSGGAKKGGSRSRSTSASSKPASRAKSGGRKPAAKSTARGSAAKGRSGAKAGGAKASTAKSKSTTRAKAGAAKKSTAAKSGAKRGTRAGGRGGEISAKTVAELREALSARMIDPLGLVMLTRDRIEEVVDEAVTRGRVTADDAQDLIGGLLERGRKQTNDVLADLEGLLARGREELGGRAGGARKRGADAARAAKTRVEQATTRARKEAVKHGDPVMTRVDQARRAGGIGPSFPITAYDDLTAAQVQDRLTGLSAAELRKVRDYERRNANRKTVLAAIAAKLD